MNRLTSTGLLLALLIVQSSHAQDDIFESKFPTEKQAALLVDVSVGKILENTLINGLLSMAGGIERMGPPIKLEDYKKIKRITVFAGNPEYRGDDSEFLVRVSFNNAEDVPRMVESIFPWGVDFVKVDGWMVGKSDREWPQVVRYRGSALEFGSNLYCYTPTKSIVSDRMKTAFASLNKDAAVRISADMQVFSAFLDQLMKMDDAESRALREMFEWGQWINESSMALYAIDSAKQVASMSFEVNLDNQPLARLSIVPITEHTASVKAKSKILADFLMFHLKLPIAFLQKNESPIGGILEKLAKGVTVAEKDESIEITLSAPDNLSAEFIAIAKKMGVAAKQMEDVNKMKQLGLALHNYHDTQRAFPFYPNPAIRISKDLSWRVKVLPYMEADHLYDLFDLSKGWDAPENSKLVGRASNLFTLGNGASICGIKTERPATRMSSILDGTSNTVMLIENPNIKMTPWTKPDTLTLDQAVDLVAELEKGQSLLVTMFDGSVGRILSLKDSGISKRAIRNLFDPADGNPIDTEILVRSNRPSILPPVPQPKRRFYDRYEKKSSKAYDAPDDAGGDFRSKRFDRKDFPSKRDDRGFKGEEKEEAIREVPKAFSNRKGLSKLKNIEREARELLEKKSIDSPKYKLIDRELLKQLKESTGPQKLKSSFEDKK